MSFRIKMLSWIVAVNLGITGILLCTILGNIKTQSMGYEKNAERFAEQREEIIRRLEDILVFKERMAQKELAHVNAGTILKWEEWKFFQDAMVLLNYTEMEGKIVFRDILLNPLGKRHRAFDDAQALKVLKTAIREDRLVLREDHENPDSFYIAIPVHVRSEPAEDEESPGAVEGRVFGGALVQPRFPLYQKPGDYFDWILFWTAMAGGTLVLILVTYTILSTMVIRPVERMAQAADSVAAGNFSIHCPEVGSRDEIGRMISSFNYMLDEVRDYHHHLEEKVRDIRDYASVRAYQAADPG